MLTLLRFIATLTGTLALAAISAVPGYTQANVYEGKTIRMIVAVATGGGYDNYARLAARHIGKHIPANPTVIVQNMPGASGIVAANHVFNVAPKDGSVIGALHASIVLAQISGTPNIEYDARKTMWIGRLVSAGHDVHYTWAASKVSAFDDLTKREVIVGGTGPTSNSVILSNAINKVMGDKLKVLRGYQGTADTALAMERGEIEMAMKNWDLIRNQHADWLRDKKINLLVQYNLSRHPELPNVPTILDVARTEEEKQVWRLLLSPIAIGYALAMAPDNPADRVAILRKAFDAMVKDPEFIADAEKAKLSIDPLPGSEIDKQVKVMFAADAKAVSAATDLLKP